MKALDGKKESLKTLCLSECGYFEIIPVRLITGQVKLGSPQQPTTRDLVFATHSLLTSRHGGKTDSTRCCFIEAQHMNDMTDMKKRRFK